MSSGRAPPVHGPRTGWPGGPPVLGLRVEPSARTIEGIHGLSLPRPAQRGDRELHHLHRRPAARHARSAQSRVRVDGPHPRCLERRHLLPLLLRRCGVRGMVEPPIPDGSLPRASRGIAFRSGPEPHERARMALPADRCIRERDLPRGGEHARPPGLRADSASLGLVRRADSGLQRTDRVAGPLASALGRAGLARLPSPHFLAAAGPGEVLPPRGPHPAPVLVDEPAALVRILDVSIA